MEQITSAQDNRVKQANKLKERRERDKTGLALIEGVHSIEEAYQNGIVITQLLATESTRLNQQIIIYAQEVFEINMKVAESLSDTVTPQGFFAIIGKPHYDISKAQQVLLIGHVQDPENLGTLIRTADTAGIDAVVMEEDTTDPYRDKVLRVSQGSVLHLPVMTQGLNTFITQFNGPVYGIALENAVAYKEVASSDSFALLLGNEGEGVNPELLTHTIQNLVISIYGRAESLSVAIAGSILLYHLKS